MDDLVRYIGSLSEQDRNTFISCVTNQASPRQLQKLGDFSDADLQVYNRILALPNEDLESLIKTMLIPPCPYCDSDIVSDRCGTCGYYNNSIHCPQCTQIATAVAPGFYCDHCEVTWLQKLGAMRHKVKRAECDCAAVLNLITMKMDSNCHCGDTVKDTNSPLLRFAKALDRGNKVCDADLLVELNWNLLAEVFAMSPGPQRYISEVLLVSALRSYIQL